MATLLCISADRRDQLFGTRCPNLRRQIGTSDMRADVLHDDLVHQTVHGTTRRGNKMKRRRAIVLRRERPFDRCDLSSDSADSFDEGVIALGEMSHRVPPYTIYLAYSILG